MNKVNAEVRTNSLVALPEQASVHGRTWRVVDITSIFKAILDFFASLFSCFSAEKSNAVELKEKITSAPTSDAQKNSEKLRTVNESIDKMKQKKLEGKDIAIDLTIARTQLMAIERTLDENLGLEQDEIARLKNQLIFLEKI